MVERPLAKGHGRPAQQSLDGVGDAFRGVHEIRPCPQPRRDELGVAPCLGQLVARSVERQLLLAHAAPDGLADDPDQLDLGIESGPVMTYLAWSCPFEVST